MFKSRSMEYEGSPDDDAHINTLRIAATPVMVMLACLLASASIASAAEDNVIESGYRSFAKFLRGLSNPKKGGEIVRLRNDGRPFPLHTSPSERSAITARLEPPTRYVEIVKGCTGEWCHVRLGLAAGWIRKDRLRPPGEFQNEKPEVRSANRATPERDATGALPNVGQDAGETANAGVSDVQPVKVASVNFVNIPLPIRKQPLEPKIQQVSAPALPAAVLPSALQPASGAESIAKVEPAVQAEPAALEVKTAPFRQETERKIAAVQPDDIANTSLKVSDIPKKLYSLTNVEDITFLPVREDRSDEAQILGGIPYFANNVEALGLCVNEWCLVRYGKDLRGWIRQRHLSDTHKEKTPRLQLQNTRETPVALYDEPDPRGRVASFIDPQAKGIVPTGTCDLEWCHVLHDGKTGWIRSLYLARQ